MLAASSKGKVSVNAKLLGRRSAEEGQFLDDLIQFIVNAGARCNEELFSFRSEGGHRKALRGSAVREELKHTCSLFEFIIYFIFNF